MFPIIKNIIIGQVSAALPTFATILNEFELIIEIGTHRGGFSMWLYENKQKNCIFKTYEIDKSVIQLPHDTKINILITDCFSEVCQNDIENLIKNNGKTLLLCDGGHKNEEFIFYSKYLKIGDVIMLHDYTDNLKEYDSISKIHNWPYGPESHYTAIETTVIENKLQKYKYEEFKHVLWGSFIKE